MLSREPSKLYRKLLDLWSAVLPLLVAIDNAVDGDWHIAALWMVLTFVSLALLAFARPDRVRAWLAPGLVMLTRFTKRRHDDLKTITLWHNQHPERTTGWQSHHPMKAVFVFTLPVYLSRGDKDTHYDLDHLRARFTFTGDPGDDELLRLYQVHGLRPLEDGDVIEINDPRKKTPFTRWQIRPNGYTPAIGPWTRDHSN
ncbi:hypothetical protein ACQPYK_49465 (plasmid) [Streptosporangium sp. CA-135522]|uniref:hypothetical protein n=1 Tax=Streptosporangium sp. CA-135522 TaxID=3240072 RepID=UPI003D8A88C2